MLNSGGVNLEETAMASCHGHPLENLLTSKEAWHDSGCGAPISRTCTGNPGRCGTTADWVPWDKNKNEQDRQTTNETKQNTTKTKQNKHNQQASKQTNKPNKPNKENKPNKQRTRKTNQTNKEQGKQTKQTKNKQPNKKQQATSNNQQSINNQQPTTNSQQQQETTQFWLAAGCFFCLFSHYLGIRSSAWRHYERSFVGSHSITVRQSRCFFRCELIVGEGSGAMAPNGSFWVIHYDLFGMV